MAWCRGEISGSAMSPRLASVVLIAICISISATAQVPCEYELAAIIRAPDCAFTGTPPTIATGISPDGRYVVGYYAHCEVSGRYEAFVYHTYTGQFFTIPRPKGITSALARGVNNSSLVIGESSRPGVGTRAFAYDINTGAWEEFEPLKGHTLSQANAIAADKPVVVGSSSGPSQAVAWHEREIADLNLPYGPNSGARDIDPSGSYIAGWMGPSSSTDSHGFVWTEDGVIDMDVLPGGDACLGNAVNALGEAGGASRIPCSEICTQAWQPVLWADDELQQIRNLEDYLGGVVLAMNATTLVGYSEGTDLDPNREDAFVCDRFETQNLNEMLVSGSNWRLTRARGTNPRGEIVGQAQEVFENKVVAFHLTPVPRSGDVTCDGLRNINDLLEIIANWGPCRGCAADLNGDWTVNVDDLLEVINNWS